MIRSIIDSEKLIEEVKKRPTLYNGGSGLGKNNYDAKACAKLRKPYWEEVTKEIFQSVWGGTNESERESLMKEVQVKWKYLRDSYTRSKKGEKAEEHMGLYKPRKKYVYSDQLRFLDAVISDGNGNGNSNSNSNSSPNAIFLQDHTDDPEIEDNHDNLEDAFLDHADLNQVGLNDQELYEPTLPSITHVETSRDLQGGNSDNLSSVLAEMLRLQKEERKDDRMGNKKFLLSLLPFLEKLPVDINLEVRLQIMAILQTYTSGENFTKT